MGEDSAPPFVCATCGGAIGVYERCLVVISGRPVEISWLSLAKDEREAARANYHRACYAQGAADAGGALTPAAGEGLAGRGPF
jgi:hypothetical protein